jgi:hypothetical protein
VNVLSFVLQLGLGILLPFWVVRRDERRLPPVQLDRTWNEPSFWAAIVTFGPLCIPVHFVKSRRSLLGLLLGVAWMVGVFGAIAGLEWLFEALTGIP